MKSCVRCGRELTGDQELYCGQLCNNAVYMRRYRQKNRGAVIAYNSGYQRTERGKQFHMLAVIRYLSSDKGKAMLRRRYELLGNNGGWHDKANYWIFVENRPCVGCGETDKSLLQCDHIIPRAVGGTDDDWNLQILCKKCHRHKTNDDIRIIWIWKGV